MTGGVLGGGVIFVVAALLWAAVLVPSWMRRREFRAAERNALRLQRTLRVLAETSEVPEEIRLEATAKEALAHEKILRSARKQLDAERAADLADARAEQVRAEIRAQQMKRKERAAVHASRLRRPVVRRVRATAALGAVLGLLTMLVGVGVAIAGVGAAALIWGALVTATSVGALVLLAPGRVRTKVLPVEIEVCDEAAQLPVQVEPVAVTDVSAQAEAHRRAQQAAAERIERARALARARAARPAPRENQIDSMLLGEPGAVAAAAAAAVGTLQPERRTLTPEHVPAPRPAVARPAAAAYGAAAPRPAVPQAPRYTSQQEAARARLRQMGVVGDTSEGMLNLDDVLRRRRSS
ncbi:hypothetical protein JOF28_002381 [Leucobacter exalbidus]|uniref:Large exoprotein n=1 Tax=Leucobacter exalbidus TaxID=662960 RepID=A0A940T4T1_9MICO|nr:hypothetical protein [Leucobacter exalbidus]MBP1327149.1 hypothetical protein [Leucobacter exalbidus]